MTRNYGGNTLVPFGTAVVSIYHTNDGSTQYQVERSQPGIQARIYRKKFARQGTWNNEPQDFYTDFMIYGGYNPGNPRARGTWVPNQRAILLKFHKAAQGFSNATVYSVYLGDTDHLGQTWTYLGPT